jgi:hypothetical protein
MREKPHHAAGRSRIAPILASARTGSIRATGRGEACLAPTTHAIAAAIAACTVLFALPAAAIDGEVLIDQAKVNAGGVTPDDDPGFPATLGKPGRYKLSGNLRVPAGVNGIEVTANDATIDLNGFTIGSAVPGDAGRGVYAVAGVNRTRVINGTITGFGNYGILGLGTNFIVEDMRIVGNATAIQLGTEGLVRNSTVANNTSIGIRCYRCLIAGNLVAGNGNAGIFDSDAGGGLVLGNVIVGNAGYGIVSPDPPYPKTGYGNNVLVGNNSGGLQGLGIAQLHPNVCDPACP